MRAYTEVVNSIRNGIIFVLPEWSSDSSIGLTVDQISEETNYSKQFLTRFLKKGRRGIESVCYSDQKNKIFRKVKKR